MNIAHSNGVTPLIVASGLGHAKVVQLLLNHSQIDVNKAFSSGETPLYLASERGQAEVVKILLRQSKINVNI